MLEPKVSNKPFDGFIKVQRRPTPSKKPLNNLSYLRNASPDQVSRGSNAGAVFWPRAAGCSRPYHWLRGRVVGKDWASEPVLVFGEKSEQRDLSASDFIIAGGGVSGPAA